MPILWFMSNFIRQHIRNQLFRAVIKIFSMKTQTALKLWADRFSSRLHLLSARMCPMLVTYLSNNAHFGLPRGLVRVNQSLLETLWVTQHQAGSLWSIQLINWNISMMLQTGEKQTLDYTSTLVNTGGGRGSGGRAGRPVTSWVGFQSLLELSLSN